MDYSFSWECPFCNHHATITGHQHSMRTHDFYCNNKESETLVLTTKAIVCPNSNCREYVLSAALHKTYMASGRQKVDPTPLLAWELRPQSSAKTFPDYIPAPILNDYREACLIRDLSPKASATLSRRCLQGIIRDFWGVSGGSLSQEIIKVKDKVDSLTWKAIDAVRSIGNIGAHMEKDISVIVDVDGNEAALLINLIELLLKDWYVTRHERADRLNAVVKVAEQKNEDKRPQKPVQQTSNSPS